MKDAYIYDPRADVYVIPTATMARMIRRMTMPKDKVEAEDVAENARRVREAQR